MQRIIPLELVGKDKLEYDLYDENGQLLFAKGHPLDTGLLLRLNCKKVYKKLDDVIDNIQDKNIIVKTEQQAKIESIISKTATETLVTNTKKILKEVMKSGSADTSVCEATRDIILDEVSDKIEKIDCIGQLRVFDEYTFSHTVNVSTMSSALGFTLGFDEEDLKDLALGALLHDIGKMRVPIDILNKPGKLTEEEFEFMKAHTTLGYHVIIDEMKLPEKIALVALQHQEKYGGFGYPNKLKGKEISVFAQVTSIADVYDALVSKRVYKQPIPSHEAVKIMLADGSKCFNPFMLYKFVYLANYKNSVDLHISDEDRI